MGDRAAIPAPCRIADDRFPAAVVVLEHGLQNKLQRSVGRDPVDAPISFGVVEAFPQHDTEGILSRAKQIGDIVGGIIGCLFVDRPWRVEKTIADLPTVKLQLMMP